MTTSLRGTSISAAGFSTNISAGTDTSFGIDLNGDGVKTVVLTVAGKNTGALIAAEIQTKVRALTPTDSRNQLAYDDFTCAFNSVTGYTLRSGTIRLGSSVVVTAGATNNVADNLKLGLANGGTETVGDSISSDGPYAISKRIRTVFVEALRAAFATDLTWPYEVVSGTQRTDIDTSLIEITDSTPEEAVKYPAIIVSSTSDREGSIYFHDDLLSEVRDENSILVGEEHGNQVRLTVDLEVWAYDSISREEITDQIYIYLKTLKDVFSTNGIEIRMVRLIPPRQDPIGTRIHFVTGLSVDTYSEWTYTETVPSSELISDFIVDVQNSLSDN